MATRDTRRARGSALVIMLVVSSVLSILGIAYLTLAENEVIRAKERADRVRSRTACRDVLEVAARWFDPGAPRALLPGDAEWDRSARRGDADGDGRLDAACDGADPAGRFGGNLADPGDDPATAPRRALCGTAETPDLLLHDTPFLVDLAATLGDDVVIERLSVSAPPRVDGAGVVRATIACTVAVRRMGILHARARAEAHVRVLPALVGPEVVAAGGDVILSPGGAVRWGVVQAKGDVLLPPRDAAGFPASGLPRGNDGRTPLSFAPGGVVDWDLTTSRRECPLTELMGITSGGRLTWGALQPPALGDPWLSIRSGRLVHVGDEDPRAAGRGQTHHPHPFDVRSMTLDQDLSHLSQGYPDFEPFDAARVAELLASEGSPGVRRLAMVSGGSGEPLWREQGLGPARTAAAWVESCGPQVWLFDSGGAVPASVTLRAGRGVVLLSAGTLVLSAADRASVEGIDMPGEPFQDSGIDADGDGIIDAGTAGNGRWDLDADGDGQADAGVVDPMILEAVHHDVVNGHVPDEDADPARRRWVPHEAFLNLAYPAGGGDFAVHVDYQAGRGSSGQPVGDPPPDGTQRRTTMARDAVGARVDLPLHFHGLIANLAGDVDVQAGYRMSGAVRARGSVTIQPQAEVSFDDGLSHDGWPSLPGLPRVQVVDVAWHAGAPPRPRLPVPDGSVTPAPQPPAPASGAKPRPLPGGDPRPSPPAPHVRPRSAR